MNNKQALEACFEDTIFFKNMLMQINEQPEKGLLINGFLTEVAMFVVESYDIYTQLELVRKDCFDNEFIERLRLSRHRAKLFDSKKDLIEVLNMLEVIQDNEINRFKKLKNTNIASILTFLGSDMGITKFNGKFITTTHSTIWDFGPNFELEENYAYELGYGIGNYLQTIIDTLKIREDVNFKKYDSKIDEFEMIDIRSRKLYERSNFQTSSKKFALALPLILVRLNYTKLITTQFFPNNSLGLLRLKFINSYHASSSLKKIQSLIMSNEPSDVEKDFFKSVFANDDVKWLLKQESLRNFLAHYLLDDNQLKRMPLTFGRREAIEILSKNSNIYEIQEKIDRVSANITLNIEKFLNLKSNTFWLNKVRI